MSIKTLLFVVVTAICTMAAGQERIAEREYWIDGSVATRTPLDASPTQIDLSRLSAGLHTLTVRVKNDSGVWSSTVTKHFIMPSPEASSPSDIVEREYWIDGKIATRTSLDASPAQIDLSGLSAGVHTLTTRVKDNSGAWSSTVTKHFIMPSSETPSPTGIVESEYWIDGKVATRTFLNASPAQINLVKLSTGMHSLTMRVKDDLGMWSSTVTKYFVIYPIAQGEKTITRYMYWFDDETNALTAGTLSAKNGVISMSVKRLSEGKHKLSWRVADSKGIWSDVAMDSFLVTKAELTKDMVSIVQDSFIYTGEEITPEVMAISGDTALKEGTDYFVTYTENINAGTAFVTITPTAESGYKGEVVIHFDIAKADPTITPPMPIEAEGLSYTGEPQTLITAGTVEGGEMRYSLDNENYSDTLPQGTNIGEYTIYYLVEGDSNHNDMAAQSITTFINSISGVEIINNDSTAQKPKVYLINGRIFIHMPDGRIYTLVGEKVK